MVRRTSDQSLIGIHFTDAHDFRFRTVSAIKKATGFSRWPILDLPDILIVHEVFWFHLFVLADP